MLSEYTFSVAIFTFIAYLYSSIVGAFFITCIFETLHEDNYLVDKIKGKDKDPDYNPDNGWVRNQWQTITLGIIERVLYLTSILVGRPEFIAVWLTLKTVYKSWPELKDYPVRKTYNNFLIGNGLSIFYAFAGAGIIQWATGSILPHASLPTILQKNILLFLFSLAAPIILSLALNAFLCYARKLLNDQLRDKSSITTQPQRIPKSKKIKY